MSTLEHLSNEELVKELYERINPTYIKVNILRRKALRDEILKRLNEPWRKQKEGFMSILKEHYESLISILRKYKQPQSLHEIPDYYECLDDNEMNKLKEIEELYEE